MEPSRQGSDTDDDDQWYENAQLFREIRKGKLDKVRALLESGVKTDITDKNNKENTPLHYAVEKDKTEIIVELLQPNWKTNLNLKNTKGRTPLDIAIKKNNQEIIQLLRNHRVEVSDDGKYAEPAFVESTPDKNETENQKNSLSLKFQKTKGAAGIEGQLCEINLSIFLLLKGKSDNRVTEFYLASNVEKADKFDDIVFKYTNRSGKSKIIFLQSKHKTGDQENTSKKVQLTSLLSDSESGDFSLNKYFISYRKIKKHFLNRENAHDPIFSGNFDECQFLMYTNAPFEYSKNNCVKEIEMDENDVFTIEGSQGKIFQLDCDSDKKNKIFEIFKNSSDCKRLGKALAAAFSSKDGLDIQKDIFQTYHKALKQHVIAKIDDSTGKLSENFLQQMELQFNSVFFEEAAKISRKTVDAVKNELKMRPIKLSNKFWTENDTGFSDLPNDDPIDENEIRDFLTKFKLYAYQSNEKGLESATKKIAAKFYKIEKQDIGLVFAGVENEVKNWWQDKDYYLMKYNEFFEDALRISVQFDVSEPVSLFTGRKQALEDLHKILQEKRAITISQRASITGLGGIGKSELTRKYLSEYKNHYDKNIIWINAESDLTITQSFQNLAQDKLKIRTTDDKNKEKDIKILAEEVYNFFDRMHRKSIFVFDNAEKRWPGDGYVDKLLPSGLNKPYFIITTRHQDWYGIQKLPLELFTQEEAEAFIRLALKDKIKIGEDELQELIKELGCLPLALRQAVAYITVENETTMKWSDKQFTITCYLKLLQENAKEILRDDRTDDHTKTIMTTWKTSMEKIKQGSERAVAILHVMAYLAPDQIQVDEIFETEIVGKNELHYATELLEKYSMIEIKGGKVGIHRLVQKVTRIEIEEMKQDEQTLTHTLKLLRDCYPYGSREMVDGLKRRRMLPHFESFLSHIDEMIRNKPQEKAKIEKKYFAGLFDLMADGYELKPQRGKQLLERALKIHEEYYGPDHFQVARILTNLGNAYGSLGDAQKKKQLLERALTIQENYYGPDHFEVAITLTNLGSAYGSLGDAQKQKQLLERALKIFENYYGPDHFQVATTLGSLGNAYGSLGDAQKQKQLLERALTIEENYYGPDHFEVAITLGNLGNAYGSLGDAQKEKQLQERALTIKENYYGPDHFQVAATLTNLGNAYGSLGDAQTKKQLLERALTIKENYYGPDHFQVATTLGSLGNAYGSLGDAQKQKQLLERALTIFENYYGPDHFQVAGTLTNLGGAYGSLVDAQKKKLLLERALTIFENYYGPDHFQVAMTLTNLGGAYGSLGDAQKQKQLLERALTIFENYYGPDHYEVAITLGSLGNAYGCLGDARKKKQLLERALTIQENYYGPDHFEVAGTLGSLGNAYGSLGDAQKQKQLLERALTIKKNFYGPDHFQVALTLSNLGNTYGSLGDAQKQKQLLECALTIEENYYGLDHFQVAGTLTNLGNAYLALGDAQKQKQLLERALTIKENFYGPDHFQVAATLSNLGNAYGSLGEAQKQKQLLERALTIEENYYGPDHFEVAITLTNLGSAYLSLGDAPKQKQLLERALKIFENDYGPDHFQVAATLANLGTAYGCLGDAQKQKQLLERALTIKENYYGPDHFQVAATLFNLGNAYGSLGDAQKHKHLLERALLIFENYYGPDHVEVAKTLTNLGIVYGSLGDAQKRKQLLERALPILENHYGFDYSKVATIRAFLGLF